MFCRRPFLYGRTIGENIAIARPGAAREEVFAAARTASVHDVIESFADGYDTVVGERGVTLSGGQKQRVAIARTLLTNAPIMIFDDSLSAVDAETGRRHPRRADREKGLHNVPHQPPHRHGAPGRLDPS